MGYTTEEVRANGLGIGLTENAIKVLANRYLAKDETGGYTELPSEMFRRVAKSVAAGSNNYTKGPGAEELEGRFYNEMVDGRFMPN
mgnify:CR=1 FL=1